MAAKDNRGTSKTPTIKKVVHKCDFACERVVRDESLAPVVDRDLLLRLVRQELPEEVVADVYRLIHSFNCWRDAHAQILVENHNLPT